MAEGLLSDASYVWVIIFLILTGCGLPIPEEVGIIAAGVWAADGAMNFWLGLAACLFGCIVGDSIMYYIGYRFGKNVLREHPMFTGFLTPEREKRIEQLIRRKGSMVLFTARFMVGVRGPVYLTAGILHYPYRRFLLTDLVCATIVVTLFYSLAWYFGEDILAWIRKAEEGVTVAVIVALVGGALLFWVHHRRSKAVLESLDSKAMTAREEKDAEFASAAVHARDATPTTTANDRDSQSVQLQSPDHHAE
jgi:membrane protein DedA with SNARE-associated domain